MIKILVIGNGFDLAHNLPTKYMEFLSFLTSFKNTALINQRNASSMYEILENDDEDTKKEKRKSIYDKTIELNSTSYPNIPKEFLQFLFNNSIQNNLIKYYIIKSKKLTENWIDFEKELEQIIIDYKLFFSSPKNHPLKFEYLQIWGEKYNNISHDHRFKRWFENSPKIAIIQARLKGGNRKPNTGNL